MDISWNEVEDACPENRELARVLRKLEGIHGGGPRVDWWQSRERCAEVLNLFRASHDPSAEVAASLEGADFEVGGDEHHLVRVDDQPDRVFKLTHSDIFGCRPYFSPHDTDLTGKHFHGTGNESPVFYLQRWMLLNFISDYRTRFEGMLPEQVGLRLPRICVSQPQITAGNPGRSAICDGMAQFGFKQVSEDAFLQEPTGILLTDVAPRNVRIVEGAPVPFDAIAMFATEAVLAWVASRRLPAAR
jgi:hypothetical protein